MDIPVIVLTRNRPDYLSGIIDEHIRVNSPLPLYIVDDGSDDPEHVKLLTEMEEKDSRCVVLPFRHAHHRKSVLRIIRTFRDLGYEYIAYTEDDAIFSINWYQYGVATLNKLRETVDVGVLALYSGHPKVLKHIFGSVYQHSNKEHFYGSCCDFIKTSIVDDMERVMFGSKGANNPDVAIRWLSMNEGLGLYIVYPNLAQHEGVDRSLMKSPKHHSSTFYGADKDALVLL